MMTHSGFWSTSDPLQAYPYGLKHGFRPTGTCLIIKILATWEKFIQPSEYWTVINCALTYCITNVFCCLCGVITEFDLVKYKFSNLTTLHIDLSSFQIACRVQKCITYQHTNYHNTVNHIGYFPQLELLLTLDSCAAN